MATMDCSGHGSDAETTATKRFKTSFDEALGTMTNTDEAATTTLTSTPEEGVTLTKQLSTESAETNGHSDEEIRNACSKRRERKMQDKGLIENDEEGTLRVCNACKLYFERTKRRTGMCHNCHKLFTKAEGIAEGLEGQILDFDAEASEIVITCKNAHMWRVSFVPRAITGGTIRQVKYWCARCERSERDARKAFHRERDADRMRELSEM
jgi:hypothetical protein